MTILNGEGRPLADLGLYHSIETAPKDKPIWGAWISKTGKLLDEERVEYFVGIADGIDDDDCPVNIDQWCGFSNNDGYVVFPSHWRGLESAL